MPSNPIVMADNDLKQISASMDGLTYRTLAGRQDFIFADKASELNIIYSDTSLEVQINEGMALMCGRTLEVISPMSITLQAFTTVDLCMRIDLSMSSGNEGMLYLNSPGVLTQQDLNNEGQIYDLPLFRITTGDVSVTSVNDMRVIKDSVGPTSTGILYGLNPPSPEIGEDGDIYVQYS